MLVYERLAMQQKALRDKPKMQAMEPGLIGAPELARKLGLDPKWLRQLIRDHKLVPSHPHGTRYGLDGDDVARISRHPAVQQAIENNRRGVG